MIDPQTLMFAVKVVMALKKTLDVAELKRRMKRVEGAVEMIDRKIDETLLIDYRSAFDHLVAAQYATTEALRQSELSNARSNFVRLTHRPYTRPATVGGKELTHPQLVAIGHVGNFDYFLLQDDPRQALAEAYLCAEKFPLLAIENFPAEIFSRDYAAALRSISKQADDQHQAALKRHAETRAQYRERRKSYLLEMAWKAPLAGGAILAGLAAAAVVPSMAGRGVQYAAGIMSGMGDEGVLPPLSPSFVVVDLAKPAIAELMNEVKTDAAERLAVLQR
jgi:hypothetical protein